MREKRRNAGTYQPEMTLDSTTIYTVNTIYNLFYKYQRKQIHLRDDKHNFQLYICTIIFHNIFHASLQAAFRSGKKSSNLPNFKILKPAETQIHVLTKMNFS